MTPKEKIASVIPAHDEIPYTTKQISEAVQLRFGPISKGQTCEHDFTYYHLNSLSKDGVIQRHGRGKGPAIKWNRIEKKI